MTNPLSSIFNSNTLIETFNELKFMGVTGLHNDGFYGCSALKEVDCRNILDITATTNVQRKWFKGCSSLVKINLASCREFGMTAACTASRCLLANCSSLHRLILPSITGYHSLFINSERAPLTMVDLGPNLTTLKHSGERGFTTNCIFVVRATTPATFNSLTTIAVSKLFVPAGSVDTYKAASVWSKVASKTYAIGGDEWIAEFGSSDEYANLTEEEYSENYAG